MKPASTTPKFKSGLSKYSILTLVGLVIFAAVVFEANPFNQPTAASSVPTGVASPPLVATGPAQTAAPVGASAASSAAATQPVSSAVGSGHHHHNSSAATQNFTSLSSSG